MCDSLHWEIFNPPTDVLRSTFPVFEAEVQKAVIYLSINFIFWPTLYLWCCPPTIFAVLLRRGTGRSCSKQGHHSCLRRQLLVVQHGIYGRPNERMAWKNEESDQELCNAIDKVRAVKAFDDSNQPQAIKTLLDQAVRALRNHQNGWIKVTHCQLIRIPSFQHPRGPSFQQPRGRLACSTLFSMRAYAHPVFSSLFVCGKLLRRMFLVFAIVWSTTHCCSTFVCRSGFAPARCGEVRARAVFTYAHCCKFLHTARELSCTLWCGRTLTSRGFARVRPAIVSVTSSNTMNGCSGRRSGCSSSRCASEAWVAPHRQAHLTYHVSPRSARGTSKLGHQSDWWGKSVGSSANPD